MNRRLGALAVATVLALTGAACGGDDSADPAAPTTTRAESDAPTTSDPADADDPGDDETTTTTEAPATEAPTTTEAATSPGPDVTTSPNLAPNDSPLNELLLDLAEVGEGGYTPDDSLGDGTFDPDFCEDVRIEAPWEDQAARAALRGTGDDAIAFQQVVLRFADAAAATAFSDEVSEAFVTCQPGTTVADVPGVGDAAVLATAPEDVTGVTAGLVRVGDLVGYSFALGRSGATLPVDEDHLAAVAARLVA